MAALLDVERTIDLLDAATAALERRAEAAERAWEAENGRANRAEQRAERGPQKAMFPSMRHQGAKRARQALPRRSCRPWRTTPPRRCHLRQSNAFGREGAERHRSGMSTETGQRLFGRLAKSAAITVNASMCGAAATAATNTVRMVQTFDCDGAGARSGSTEPHDLIQWRIYAAAISRVAFTGSFNTLQSADRFSSRGRQ